MSAYVKLKIIQKVAYVEFFNPPHNSLTPDLIDKLIKTIIKAGVDKNIHIIVLKSGGDRVFCAGASFNHMVDIKTKNQGKNFFMGFANLINTLRTCPKIIIGSVHGKAIGGAVGIAAATDICYASEYASIKLSEISIGIGPFVIEPAIRRKIGLSAFTHLALKSQTFFSAKWAREKGLFAEVFESNNDLNSEVQILANELSDYNPEALSALKKILWQDINNWDELLMDRASISGDLVLSSFAKSFLNNY